MLHEQFCEEDLNSNDEAEDSDNYWFNVPGVDRPHRFSVVLDP